MFHGRCFTTDRWRRASIPDAALMQARLLFLLLDGIVAGLADAAQVALIPELAFITTVRLDMIADQLGSVGLYSPASRHLACEQVARQYLPAQLAPTFQLVPLSPRCRRIPRPFIPLRLLDLQSWRQRRQARPR